MMRLQALLAPLEHAGLVNESGLPRERTQAVTSSSARPGRNDPCSCGSGKKFKRCCGRIAPASNSPRTIGRFEASVSSDQTYAACIRHADQMRRAGRIADCIPPLRQAAQLRPNVAEVHFDLGRLLLELGQAGQAVGYLQQAVSLKRKDAQMHFHLGLAQESLGQIPEAIATLSRAITLDSKLVQAHARLAQLLLTVGDRKTAIETYRRASALSPKSEQGRICLAHALMEENQPAEAEQSLRETIVLHPDSGSALGLLGRILVQSGRFDEAEAQFLQAMEIDPRRTNYHYDIARGRKMTEADQPLIQHMRDALDSQGMSARNRYGTYLALGKAVDDLGDPGEAMRCWHEANRSKSQISPFDRDEFARRIEPIAKSFTRELIAGSATTTSDEITPVLIIGMPRSGTTLVDQILSSHPQAQAAGELGFWTRVGQEFLLKSIEPDAVFLLQAAASYVERLRSIAPSVPFVTDKMPQNFLWAGLIHLVFPNARFIHCRRHPVDTCLSIFSTYFGPKPDFSTDPGDLVFYYRRYLQLMSHWRTVIPANRLMDIEYESLIAEPEPAIRRMVDFCGLEWDEACLSPERNRRVVKTASTWQVRQPINAGSVARWRRYEPWLGELVELFPAAG